MKFDLTNTRIFLRPGVTVLRISTDELLHLIKKAMLLTGIDFTQMHEELHFEKFA